VKNRLSVKDPPSGRLTSAAAGFGALIAGSSMRLGVRSWSPAAKKTGMPPVRKVLDP